MEEHNKKDHKLSRQIISSSVIKNANNIINLPKPTALTSLGLSCCTALFAVNFTHPIETVKTRLQVRSLITRATSLLDILAYMK